MLTITTVVTGLRDGIVDHGVRPTEPAATVPRNTLQLVERLLIGLRNVNADPINHVLRSRSPANFICILTDLLGGVRYQWSRRPRDPQPGVVASCQLGRF